MFTPSLNTTRLVLSGGRMHKGLSLISLLQGIELVCLSYGKFPVLNPVQSDMTLEDMGTYVTCPAVAYELTMGLR